MSLRELSDSTDARDIDYAGSEALWSQILGSTIQETEEGVTDKEYWGCVNFVQVVPFIECLVIKKRLTKGWCIY